MKAAPMSRKVTQVTSHSPSHSKVGRLSSSGWPCMEMAGLGTEPQSALAMASSTASMP